MCDWDWLHGLYINRQDSTLGFHRDRYFWEVTVCTECTVSKWQIEWVDRLASTFKTLSTARWSRSLVGHIWCRVADPANHFETAQELPSANASSIIPAKNVHHWIWHGGQTTDRETIWYGLYFLGITILSMLFSQGVHQSLTVFWAELLIF